MSSTELMIATLGDEELKTILKAVGFDKLSEPQYKLAIAICKRYDLDPMLRHVVMIDGRPYITRDGLLHVAHNSSVFDGIEVTEPLNDGKYWRAKATVFRKDMSRPISYPGRYPTQGGNQKYAEEMAIKVAEVMTLRRAFDVSAPTLEERWDQDELPEPTPVEPVSLSDKIAARAAALQQPEAATESVIIEPSDVPVVALEPLKAVDPTAPDESILEPLDESAQVGETIDPLADLVEVAESDGEAWTYETFARWVKDEGVEPDVIKRVARELFPDGGNFKELDSNGFALVVETVQNVLARSKSSESSESSTDKLREALADPSTVILCAAKSPLSDETCTLDKGHKGVHRAGLKESW